MITDNPIVSLGIVNRSLYTRRFALKYDLYKKMDILAHTPVEISFLENLRNALIISGRQN